MWNWFERVKAWWHGSNAPSMMAQPADSAGGRIERILLSEGVASTLFDDFASHQQSARGEEEIGWDLLGYRHRDEIFAVAALPAGVHREAGVAHVQFNHDVQELLSHILRQKDKRLGVVGVVHTHPGNLRCPSDGDFQGDRLWVGQLRGGEGVFGIGTADSEPSQEPTSPHQQDRGNLCFSWYALGQGDRQYRRLRVEVTAGGDLARPLHAVWDILEAQAKPLNNLYRQLARVTCSISEVDAEPALSVTIRLAAPGQQLRLLLNAGEARYYWEKEGAVIAVEPSEGPLDRTVFLILAELAKEPMFAVRPSPSLVES